MHKYHNKNTIFVKKAKIIVSNLKRTLAFYTNILGLTLVKEEAGAAQLGTNGKDVLLVLKEVKGSKPAGANIGLYHFALLLNVREIFGALRGDDFIICYHNCGNVLPLAETLISLDADIYHFGNSIDIEKMLKLMPSEKLIMGNIDPAGQFRNGTPESVRKATKELLDRCSRYENFVISSGCDIPPLSSWDNIMAFFSAVKEYYNE